MKAKNLKKLRLEMEQAITYEYRTNHEHISQVASVVAIRIIDALVKDLEAI